jgi:single-strand DNA-binding protein
MAEGINSFHFGGNLADDPRQGDERKPTILRIAAERRYAQNGEWKEVTDYVSVLVWGARGVALGSMLRKGEGVFVEGFISTRHYTDDNEQGHWDTVLTATKVVLTGKKRTQGDEPKNEKKAPVRDERGKSSRS